MQRETVVHLLLFWFFVIAFLVSFLADGDTGMFSSGGDLIFAVDAVPRVRMGSASSLVIEGSMRLTGTTFELGSPGAIAISRDGSVLGLNPDRHFSSGIRIHGDVMIGSFGSPILTRVGVRTLLPESALHVAGGIRAGKGTPLSANNAFDAGFSFTGDGDTGMFCTGSSVSKLECFVFTLCILVRLDRSLLDSYYSSCCEKRRNMNQI